MCFLQGRCLCRFLQRKDQMKLALLLPKQLQTRTNFLLIAVVELQLNPAELRLLFFFVGLFPYNKNTENFNYNLEIRSVFTCPFSFTGIAARLTTSSPFFTKPFSIAKRFTSSTVLSVLTKLS